MESEQRSKRLHQPNIHTLQVIALEYRDGKQTDTCMSRAEEISYNVLCDWLSSRESLSSRWEGVSLLLLLYIVNVYKRLMLTPTANFASRYLQLHSSLGCVQPCTVYHCFIYLESIVDKPHQPQGPKLMPSWFLIRVSTGLNLIRTASHDSSVPLLYEDGNRLHRKDAAICGLTAVV